MGLLAKLRHFVPKQILLEIYLSPTQPYIKYGIAAWGQASKTSQQNSIATKELFGE